MRYLLVVRWPIGGIRTHLRHFRSLLGPLAASTTPVMVGLDDDSTARVVADLGITPERNLAPGIRSVKGIAWAVLKACVRRQVRVVHSEGFTSALLSAPGVFLGGQRHIVSVHDTVNDGFLSHTSPALRRALGFVLRRAYVVHAVGANSAHSLRRLPFMAKATNIMLLRNGIDTSQFATVTAKDWHAELGLTPGTTVIGYFGRYMAIKGFRTLVHAIARIARDRPDARFKVVSAGEGDYYAEDSAYVAQLGLADYFRFIGLVDNPAPLIAGCDVVAMPSLSEAFSLLAVETLCLGVPLIVSDCAGLLEVTDGSPAVRFPVGDAAALAVALLAEHERPSRATAQAHAAVARREFDFAPNARRLNALLLRAARGEPAPARAEDLCA